MGKERDVTTRKRVEDKIENEEMSSARERRRMER